MKFKRLERQRERPTGPEGWRERVKRAAAPREPVAMPAKVDVPWIPSGMLIDCLVKHGMPRRHANTIRESTQLYWIATRFYFDVIEADNGDAEAKVRVDFFRESQERLRGVELEQLQRDPDRQEPVRVGASKPTIAIPRGIDAS